MRVWFRMQTHSRPGGKERGCQRVEQEEYKKTERILAIFYRLLRGEIVQRKDLAEDYRMSPRNIGRDLAFIKNFLSENRELMGNAEIRPYSNRGGQYLEMDDFLQSRELFAIVKMLIGCRGFSKMELLTVVKKLKAYTPGKDRKLLEKLIAKEMYHYKEVGHDCNSVADHIWKLTKCINERQEITVAYYKLNREQVERRIRPVAIIFSEYYFYLIAYRSDTEDWKPLYYRVDRIAGIVEHRTRFELDRAHDFDEGELRSKIQFMFSGESRKIRFEYTGPSVQAILDRIPTARVVEVRGNAKVVEAETFGTGINMYLLMQGSRVKALAPPSFVEEMKAEIEKMRNLYHENELAGQQEAGVPGQGLASL